MVDGPLMLLFYFNLDPENASNTASGCIGGEDQMNGRATGQAIPSGSL